MAPKLNLHFPDAVLRHFGDPACRQKSDKVTAKGERTSWEIMKNKGIYVVTKPSPYRLRKEIIEGKLSTIVRKQPALRVHRRCPIIRDGFLGGYHYPERKQDQAMTDNFEGPFKDGYYEHCMNALEYIAVNVFKPLRERPMPRPRMRPRRRVVSDNI